MEWVEVTGKTLTAAEDKALDQLGVARDEAEFDVLEEPRSGLFGLMRGEARVRARVKPASVRPKNDRRRRNKDKPKKGGDGDRSATAGSNGRDASGRGSNGRGSNGRGSGRGDDNGASETRSRAATGAKSGGQTANKSDKNGAASTRGGTSDTKANMTSDDTVQDSPVDPTEVAAAAEAFLTELADAFGLDASVSTTVDGDEIEATVDGDELGLMVGPSGRTLNAIQDLTRVAAQRRLGDHVTRLRVDIAGYREKRRVALEAFTAKVAANVIETGQAKALEPMSSADRKVVHDTVNDIDGVESRSDGDDPNRRVVIVPAE